MNTTTRQLGEEARGYPSATSAVEARLAALAAGRAPEPDIGITVQRSTPVDDSVSRVLLQTGGRVTAANLDFAISRAFDNRVRYLAGSAVRAHDTNPDLVTAFVALNQPTKPADTAGLRGMHTVTANVFADPSTDAIWRKVGEGDEAVLVQDTNDDLTALLEQRRSHSMATASTEVAMGEQYSAGEGVVWYDPHTETTRWGVAVSSTLVYEPGNDSEFASVLPGTVMIVRDRDPGMEVANLETSAGSTLPAMTGFPNIVNQNMPAQTNPVKPDMSLEKQQVQNLIGDREPLNRDNMIARHLAYMSVLYSRNGEYFQRLQTLLNGTFKQKLAIP